MKDNKIDLQNVSFTILAQVGNEMCLVQMQEDELEMIQMLIRKSVKGLVRTDLAIMELRKLLMGE